eukprot:TRINITY_DN4704_c0_g1_i1.p1 TRINITY_DN4704_c0_g1~~TRINITY_DN4704_c0_g1_i1.p1  ORF type:complete len:199 (-),score=41.15 TRINITY_DN4704_c0_g1_i1:1-597(-)
MRRLIGAGAFALSVWGARVGRTLASNRDEEGGSSLDEPNPEMDHINFTRVAQSIKSKQNLLMQDVRSMEKDENCPYCVSPCSYHFRQLLVIQELCRRNPTFCAQTEDLLLWYMLQSHSCLSSIFLETFDQSVAQAKLSEEDLNQLDQVPDEEILPEYFSINDVRIWNAECTKALERHFEKYAIHRQEQLEKQAQEKQD